MKATPVERSTLDDDTRRELRNALLAHYDRHARELPWRRDANPYRVLVSEIMLQQTRVETVKGYYDAWLDRFPTVEALAGASEDDVLKAWEGLGYYRRARNLLRAARQVREEWGGDVPSAYDDLRTLPGVGEYTAGAVASIAFGEAVPAVDGNVKRVLSRLFDRARPTVKWLREVAADLVDPGRPGDWNQALMELGATVCTPRSPRCSVCPLGRHCAARAHGTQPARPERGPARSVPSVEIALAVPHLDGRVLLVRRPDGGLLGGMWAFPERELDPEGAGSFTDRSRAAALEVTAALELTATDAPAELPHCRHRFTHLEARYRPWLIAVGGRHDEPGPTARGERVVWVDPRSPGPYALPRAQQRVLTSVLAHHAEVFP
jgi:A/G-specific adenine glycosylase